MNAGLTPKGRGGLTLARVKVRRIDDLGRDPADDALVLRLERAVRRFRLQSAHNLLDEAFATYAPDALLTQVGQPLLDRLEAKQDDGALRFATSLLELRLLAHGRGWERASGPLVVLGCAPSEERTLELIALGIAVAEAHCRITYLGAATPVDLLTEVVRSEQASAVVLQAEHVRLTRFEISQLRALPVPLVFIGAAAATLARSTHATALDPVNPATSARVAGLARRESSRRSDEPSPSRPRT
ncbi:hypothetical protein OJ998_21175 [Solirubrobacter taibaiensis]|nr:hypothetical protein [Solirubrobacter taibaiensis]